MRIFKEPNLSNNWKCPICRTNKKEEVILIGIIGTEEDSIMQAEQFHLNCIDLSFDNKLNIIYQKI